MARRVEVEPKEREVGFEIIFAAGIGDRQLTRTPFNWPIVMPAQV